MRCRGRTSGRKGRNTSASRPRKRSSSAKKLTARKSSVSYSRRSISRGRSPASEGPLPRITIDCAGRADRSGTPDVVAEILLDGHHGEIQRRVERVADESDEFLGCGHGALFVNSRPEREERNGSGGRDSARIGPAGFCRKTRPKSAAHPLIICKCSKRSVSSQ